MPINKNEMLTKEDLKILFSEAYGNAAGADVYDMRMVADLFETIKNKLQIEKPYEAWDFIEVESIKFDNSPAIELMVELRDAYYILFLNKQIAVLEETKRNAPEKLPALWYQYYCEAAIYINDGFLMAFSLQRKSWDNDAQIVNKFLDFAAAMKESRWVDTMPLYKEIAANNILSEKIRARAEIIVAQIIFFYQEDVSEVDVHLNRALELTPDDYLVTKIKADYLNKTGKSSEARTQLFQLTSLQPADYNIFISIGDTYMSEGQLQLAESWYLDATKNNCLQYESYKRLINLFAVPSWFQSREPEMADLLTKIEQRLMFQDTGKINKVLFCDNKCFIDLTLYKSYRDVASAWYAFNDTDKSIAWYKKAIALYPEFTPALIDLGYVSLQTKNLNASLDYFQQALKLNPDNFEIHEGLANYYKVQGQIPEAMHECAICLALRPDWAHYVFNLRGNIYYYLSKHEDSISYYRKAIDANGNIQTYKNNLAGALQLRADELNTPEEYAKAEAMYQEAAGILNTAEIWNLFGNFYFKNKEWEKAIENYNRAISLKNNEWVYYDNKGLAYQELGNIPAVEEAYINAAANDPGGTADNKLGNFYYEQKQFEKAIASYRVAAEKNPDEPVYLENIGFVYNKAGDYYKAIEAYQKVVDGNKAKPSTLNALGLNYFNTNQLDKAIEYYKKAIQGDPANWIYFTNLALAQKQASLYEQAIASYETALQINKSDYLNWNELGILYYNKNISDKAIYCYDQAINLKPDDAVLYMNKALALIQKNKPEEAKLVIENAPEKNDTRKKAMEMWLQQFPGKG